MPFPPYQDEFGIHNAKLDTPNPADWWPVQPNVCECVGYCLMALRRLEAVSETGTDTLNLDDILALGTGALEECSTLLTCEACTRTHAHQTPDREASGMLVGATLVRISYLYLDAAYRVMALETKSDSQERAARRAGLAQGLARFDGVCGAYAQVFGGFGRGGGSGVITPMTEHLAARLKVLRAVCDWGTGAV
jgi:hypothetical protein